MSHDWLREILGRPITSAPTDASDFEWGKYPMKFDSPELTFANLSAARAMGLPPPAATGTEVLETIQELIKSAIFKRMREEREQLEAVCRESIADPEERGVLVVTEQGMVTHAGLSPFVPHKTCYWINRDALEEWLPVEVPMPRLDPELDPFGWENPL